MQSDGHKPTSDEQAWNDLQRRVARAVRAVARGPKPDASPVTIPRAPPLPRVDGPPRAPTQATGQGSLAVGGPQGVGPHGPGSAKALDEAQPPAPQAGSSVAPVALDGEGAAHRARSARTERARARAARAAGLVLLAGALVALLAPAEVATVGLSPRAAGELSRGLAAAASVEPQPGSTGSERAPELGLPFAADRGEPDVSSDEPVASDAETRGAPLRIELPTVVVVGPPEATQAVLAARPAEGDREGDAAATSDAPEPRSTSQPTTERESALATAAWRPSGASIAQEADAVPGTTLLEVRAAPATQPPSTDSQIPPTRLEPDRVSARGKLRVP